jgi:hypothetical protein
LRDTNLIIRRKGGYVVDEKDISQEIKWYYKVRSQTLIKNLLKLGMNGQYVDNRTEALAAVMDKIPPGVTVARGDSVSVDQVGVFEELITRNQNKLIDPVKRDEKGNHIYGKEERYRMEREVFFADVFITSINAITLDSKLVSIDCHGNRVSAMIFGPKKVIVVVGANKIVKDVDEALMRIHNMVVPINSIRHYLKHNYAQCGNIPCVKAGKCVECIHPDRACRYTVIIEGNGIMDGSRFDVVIVGEELGI